MTLKLEISLSAEYENESRLSKSLGECWKTWSGHPGAQRSELSEGRGRQHGQQEDPWRLGAMNLWWPSLYRCVHFPRSVWSLKQSKDNGMRASVHPCLDFAW